MAAGPPVRRSWPACLTRTGDDRDGATEAMAPIRRGTAAMRRHDAWRAPEADGTAPRGHLRRPLPDLRTAGLARQTGTTLRLKPGSAETRPARTADGPHGRGREVMRMPVPGLTALGGRRLARMLPGGWGATLAANGGAEPVHERCQHDGSMTL